MKLGRALRPRSSASADFTALGENSLDTLVVTRGMGLAGKQTTSLLMELPGGQAATAAVAVARLGWRSRYVGVVGGDLAGALVRQAIEAERVQTVVMTHADAKTRRAIVMVNAATGDRHVVEYRDPALNLGADEPADSAFSDTRILLVDLTDPAASMRAARVARAAGVRILVDVDRPDPSLDELLPLVDVVVAPAEALCTIAGTDDLSEGLARLAGSSGAAAVIATLGPTGAVAWCRGQQIWSPQQPVDVIDTTGAGDAFRAGLAAGWLGRAGDDPDLEALLADANLVAALNCRAVGAQTSLPQALEVPERLKGPV
jgi:sulfofructose kinase